MLFYKIICQSKKKRIKKLKVLTLLCTLETFCLILALPTFASEPASNNYKLQEYQFGAGSTTQSASTNYKVNGAAGEIEFGRPASTHFKIGTGLTYMQMASVSAAPTFTNPGTNYDRLQLVINNSNGPSDMQFAVQISTDSAFLTNINYVKSDNSIGATLATTDFRSYSGTGGWNSSSGVYITGLLQGTAYYVRAKSRQGNFTESDWGPSASASTSTPTLTFSVSSSSVTFNNLNASNSPIAYTDATQTTVLTTSTNAYNGYVVNARETGPLTATVGQIADYASPNSAPTTWSGLGFGYTTNDTSLTNGGGSDNRFATGTKYAGFTTSSPGDPVADHPGPILSPITNEAFTISYRVTVNNQQKAGKYSTSVLYIVVPSY